MHLEFLKKGNVMFGRIPSNSFVSMDKTFDLVGKSNTVSFYIVSYSFQYKLSSNGFTTGLGV